MAFELFSYDPVTGVRTMFDYDHEKDVAVFRREVDIAPLLKYAADKRAQSVSSYANTPDESWHLEAVIDPITQVELFKKGMDLNRPEDLPRIRREIEQNYPHLKTTDKKIWLPT